MNTGKWKKKKKHHHGCNQKDKNPFGILPQYQHPALYDFLLLTYSLDSVNVAQYNAQLYGWKLNRYFGHCRRRCRRRHLHSRCHTHSHTPMNTQRWMEYVIVLRTYVCASIAHTHKYIGSVPICVHVRFSASAHILRFFGALVEIC